jgi:hypothetical protein
MKLIAIFFLSIVSVFSSQILNYNVYDRDKYIDVMLSFDAPFNGKIQKLQSDDGVQLVLTNVVLEEEQVESVNSKVLYEISLEPMSSGRVKLDLKSLQKLQLTASKVVGDFGLRVRVKPIKAVINSKEKNLAKLLESKNITNLDSTELIKNNTKSNQESSFVYKYTIVIAVLILMIIFLLILKRKINKKSLSNVGSLFLNADTNNINVLAQKQIDASNKLVILNHQNTKYIVLIGTTNVLLDKIEESEGVVSQIDFDEVLEDNKTKISQFLDDIEELPKKTTALNSYKEKVSAIGY